MFVYDSDAVIADSVTKLGALLDTSGIVGPLVEEP